MNIEALIKSVDAIDVANAIGMPVYKKGTKNFILCPVHEEYTGHSDEHATNCILTQHGAYCFGCNQSINLIKLVSSYLKIPFAKALDIVADIAGGKEQFEEKGNLSFVKLPVDNEELKILGLQSNVSQLFFVNKSDADDDISRNYKGEELCTDKNNLTLATLYKEHQSLFNKFILAKAEEAISRYDGCIEKYTSRDSSGIKRVFNLLNKDGEILSEDFVGIKTELLRRKKVAEKIQQEYKKKVFG